MKVQQFTNYFVRLSETKNPCSLPLGAAERNVVLAEIRAVRSEATSARRQNHV